MPVPDIDLGDKWIGVIDVSQKPEIKQEVLQNTADQFKTIFDEDPKEMQELIDNWQLIQDQFDAAVLLHKETTFYEDDLNRALEALHGKNKQRIAVGRAVIAGEDTSTLDLGDKWVGVIDVSQKPEIKTEVLQNTYESYCSLSADELRTLIKKWRDLAKHLDQLLLLHFNASQQEDDLNRALDALKDKNMKRIEIGIHVMMENGAWDESEDGSDDDDGK